MKICGFSTAPDVGNHRAVLIGALAVPATALLAVGVPSPGRLSWHMAAHIACMNIAAPLAAVLLSQCNKEPTRMWSGSATLWGATLAQLAILWASHIPSVHHGVQTEPAAVIALHALLFLVALAFWLSVTGSPHQWHSVLALLVSGKLSCLLGVLLTFAPRPLFAKVHAAHSGHEALLADQHLAGLLMIAACPLSYVLTAVVLAIQAVKALDETCTSRSVAPVGR